MNDWWIAFPKHAYISGNVTKDVAIIGTLCFDIDAQQAVDRETKICVARMNARKIRKNFPRLKYEEIAERFEDDRGNESCGAIECEP